MRRGQRSGGDGQLAVHATGEVGGTGAEVGGLVTRALMEAAAAQDKDLKTRIRALHWNRRLWSTLANDCASETNALPPAARAQIISLSIWVNRHTSEVMQRREPIQPLIDVNRMIMQGLSS